MAYQREDICLVIGLAFENLIQKEAKAKTVDQKEKVANYLTSFNKVCGGLNVTFEELPLEIHGKATRFIHGGVRKDGKGIKMPSVGSSDA